MLLYKHLKSPGLNGVLVRIMWELALQYMYSVLHTYIVMIPGSTLYMHLQIVTNVPSLTYV